MIRYKCSRQLSLDGFSLPFGGKLNPENRWVKWSEAIPWDELAVAYYQTMDAKQGRPGKDARLVIAALTIKHKLTLSDEETVLQIQENPYLQYFAGFSSYKDEQPFAPSLFVEIRKRMGQEVFSSFEQIILEKIGERKKAHLEEIPEHKGKMLVDATVCEQAIRYPTDINLLNESREISEGLIDDLYRLSDLSKKPRTYRQKARRDYLKIVKNKRPSIKLRRRCIREQLQYIRRNLGHISALLDHVGCPPFPLKHKRQRQYWIIQHLYHQQSGMHKDKSKKCDDRIVSVSQPHVRPIVRGKAKRSSEFGAKISVSMKGGLTFIDNIGWDAFNEGKDLQQQVESYKDRHGYYPEVVLADQLYGSRENRKYLKKLGIRFGGKPLGRPRKVTTENAEEIQKAKEQRKRDNRERIPIEGKFGQGKNGYRLNYVRARCQRTSEAWINSIFLVMNLMVLFKEVTETYFFHFYFIIFQFFAVLKETMQRSGALAVCKPAS